jgi:hypothetical protein
MNIKSATNVKKIKLLILSGGGLAREYKSENENFFRTKNNTES